MLKHSLHPKTERDKLFQKNYINSRHYIAENCIHGKEKKKGPSHTSIKTFMPTTAQMNGTNEVRKRLGQMLPRDVRSTFSRQTPSDPGLFPQPGQPPSRRRKHNHSLHLNFKSACSRLTTGRLRRTAGASRARPGPGRGQRPGASLKKPGFGGFPLQGEKTTVKLELPYRLPSSATPRYNKQ